MRYADSKTSAGFTLMELIVVTFLISLMLFLAIPRLHSDLLFDSNKKIISWIMATTRSLREKALREQKRFDLIMDLENQCLWVSNEDTPEEELQSQKESAYRLPEDLRMIDVEYARKGTVSFGQTAISFYKKGYSDRALIHMEDEDNAQFSILIEPFLNKVAIYERYVGFMN